MNIISCLSAQIFTQYLVRSSIVPYMHVAYHCRRHVSQTKYLTLCCVGVASRNIRCTISCAYLLFDPTPGIPEGPTCTWENRKDGKIRSWSNDKTSKTNLTDAIIHLLLSRWPWVCWHTSVERRDLLAWTSKQSNQTAAGNDNMIYCGCQIIAYHNWSAHQKREFINHLPNVEKWIYSSDLVLGPSMHSGPDPNSLCFWQINWVPLKCIFRVYMRRRFQNSLGSVLLTTERGCVVWIFHL